MRLGCRAERQRQERVQLIDLRRVESAERLGSISVPTLVVAGEANRIVDAEVDRAYAALIPGAHFELLPLTGHLPQLETPGALLEVLRR